MRIGLMGVTFGSGNKGVGALAYSAMHVISSVVQEQNLDVEYTIFSDETLKEKKKIAEYFGISMDRMKFVSYSLKKINTVIALNNAIKECDTIFDFTGGDSFSDIYGLKRMLKVSMEKILVIRSEAKLVLAPQTYGPYKKNISKRLFCTIIKHADSVMARDELSSRLVENETGIKPICTSDVAFFLPYDRELNKNTEERIKIGINVSKLLWNGGYNGKNQFGLKVDYQQYIHQLLDIISQDSRFEVWLVPHVITEEIAVEDDYSLCSKLANQYSINLAPKFDSPMSAKSFISGMDVFSGARMHATIAAISSGIAVIPFSYSKKFEGLYESIGYNYTLNGRELNHNEVLDRTLQYIEGYEKLKVAAIHSSNVAQKKNELIIQTFKKVL